MENGLLMVSSFLQGDTRLPNRDLVSTTMGKHQGLFRAAADGSKKKGLRG